MTPEDNKNKFNFISKKPSLVIIAAFLLIIAGVYSISIWYTVYTADGSAFQEVINMEDFKAIDPDITVDQVRDMINTCAIVGLILSIFPILGGILAFKRKLFGVVIVCAIIGLLLIVPMLISGILSIVAIILLYLSRNEFKKTIPNQKLKSE